MVFGVSENMRSNIALSSKFIAALVGILGFLVFGFLSNEARKEVYYLCGNFSQGVAYSSVIRQLDTIRLSEYSIEESPSGKRVVHSSWLNFHLVHCDIQFNNDGVVTSALYD